MVSDFQLSVPTRIVLGRGVVDRLGELTARHGTHALLVTGRNAMRANGTLDRVGTVLRAAGVQVTTFDRVSANPRSDEVDAAIAAVRRHGCDVVVGLGGGSALDAAKAIAVGVGHGRVGPLIGTTLSSTPDALPIIAVPTTAGSGSEVTKGAIITDVERRHKAGIRGDDVFPRVAVVDPGLTDTLPRHIALESGFDAVAHAVEGYVARRANPAVDALAEKAMTLAAAGLRATAADRADDDTRDAMSTAAVLGGLCVVGASTCLPHRLQQAMGSVADVSISHGRGLAILYPAWVRLAYPYARERFDRVAALLDVTDVHDGMRGIIELLGGPTSLSSAGFRRDDVATFVANVSGNTDNDPIDGIDAELLRDVYDQVY